MKKHLLHFFVISALILPVNAIHAMNYVTSAYQQAAATGQAIKQKAQKVKEDTQALFQSINCFQDRLGCSAVQMNRIHNQLRTINLSLMPLFNLPASMASKLQKPIQFIKDKVNELQTTLQQAGTRFTKEQKAAFVSSAKKIALAAAALVAIVTVAVIAKTIVGDQGESIGYREMFTKDEQFNDSVIRYALKNKDAKGIRDHINGAHLITLKAAEAAIQADTNFPDRSNLLIELRIAINNRQAFPEVYQAPIGTPDESFVTYVKQKNIPVIKEWLENNMPTIEGLYTAEEIITNDTQYPSRSSLLSTIRQTINSKEFAEEFRAKRQSTGR